MFSVGTIIIIISMHADKNSRYLNITVTVPKDSMTVCVLYLEQRDVGAMHD